MNCRYVLVGCWLIASTVIAEPAVNYETAVKPIFDRHCVECHSGWFPAGGLRLNTLDNVLEGGKQGRAVIPGKPDKGWLVNMIIPKAGYPSRMPPGPVQLTENEINTIKEWISQGAK